MDTIDKSKWPEGEWTSEPDQKNFKTAEGFDGVVIRHHSLGHLCGYVGVSEAHPLYGKSYSDVCDLIDVNVHGGLTYAAQGNESFGKKPDLWYFGFDCAHFGDLSPGMLQYGWHYGDIYRGIDYVTRQVIALSRQLATAGD